MKGQTWNRYAYVMNNPLSYIDPLGLYWQLACVSSGGSADCEWYWVDDGGAIPIGSPGTGGRGGGGRGGHRGGSGGGKGSSSTAQKTQNFLGCVKKGTDYFSLANGVSSLTGGQIGNGPVASAFLGSSASSVITGLQWATARLTGVPGPSNSETAVALGGEYVFDFGVSQVAGQVPNVAVTAASVTSTAAFTPTASMSVTSTTTLSLSLPFGSIAQSAATALGKFGSLVKLPIDLTVAGFSAIVCSDQ